MIKFFKHLFLSRCSLGILECTKIRNNEIHDLYDKIIDELGELATAVSKSYIYNKISEKTKLSPRHISRVLNHSKKEIIV